jgi:hypothetical protein
MYAAPMIVTRSHARVSLRLSETAAALTTPRRRGVRETGRCTRMDRPRLVKSGSGPALASAPGLIQLTSWFVVGVE